VPPEPGDLIRSGLGFRVYNSLPKTAASSKLLYFTYVEIYKFYIKVVK